MSQSSDPDDALGATNFLRHLNAKHADTVLFLATHGIGGPDVISAELLAVDPDGIEVSVAGSTGPTRTVRLPFAEPVDSVAGVRKQLGALLRSARNAAPDGPRTSLEQQIASHAE